MPSFYKRKKLRQAKKSLEEGIRSWNFTKKVFCVIEFNQEA